MADEIVHKLIVPGPPDGLLTDLILCWTKGETPTDLATAKFTRDINHATCLGCKNLWRVGHYR
jgi:hypothetical protein